MINRNLARFTLAALLSLGLICTAGRVNGLAQQPSGAATQAPGNINREELDNFDRFLDNHPRAAEALRQNPALINDPTFLSQHPQLQTFLKNHPGVAQQVQANPTRFINAERRFEAHGGDISRAEAARADEFLDKHPEVAEQLRKHPGLIDNQEWVAKHPELQEFLKNHPEIRKDWKEHPRAFERRERQFERHERERKPRQ